MEAKIQAFDIFQTSLSSHYPLPLRCTTDVVGKFAAGVVDMGGEPWLANISANFRKIRNDPNAIIRGLGEDDSRKKTEAKNIETLSCDTKYLRGTWLIESSIYVSDEIL